MPNSLSIVPIRSSFPSRGGAKPPVEICSLGQVDSFCLQLAVTYVLATFRDRIASK
jgi:hypothetical protein